MRFPKWLRLSCLALGVFLLSIYTLGLPVRRPG